MSESKFVKRRFFLSNNQFFVWKNEKNKLKGKFLMNKSFVQRYVLWIKMLNSIFWNWKRILLDGNWMKIFSDNSIRKIED